MHFQKLEAWLENNVEAKSHGISFLSAVKLIRAFLRLHVHDVTVHKCLGFYATFPGHASFWHRS